MSPYKKKDAGWLKQHLGFSRDAWLPENYPPGERDTARSLVFGPGDREVWAWFPLRTPRTGSELPGICVEEDDEHPDVYHLSVDGEEPTLIVGENGQVPRDARGRVWVLSFSETFDRTRLATVEDLTLVPSSSTRLHQIFAELTAGDASHVSVALLGQAAGILAGERSDGIRRLLEGPLSATRLRVCFPRIVGTPVVPDLDAADLSPFGSLRSLECEGAQLRAPKVAQLRNLTSLSVPEIDSRVLGELEGLEELDTRGTREVCEVVAKLPSLARLRLRTCQPLDDLPASCEELHFETAGREGLLAPDWSRFGALESLTISGSDRDTCAGLIFLNDLGRPENLERLEFRNFSYITAPMKPLALLGKLSELRFLDVLEIPDLETLASSSSLRRVDWTNRDELGDPDQSRPSPKSMRWQAACVEAGASSSPSDREFDFWLRAFDDAPEHEIRPWQYSALGRAAWPADGRTGGEGEAQRELRKRLLNLAVFTPTEAAPVLEAIPLDDRTLTEWIPTVTKRSFLCSVPLASLLERAVTADPTLPELTLRKIQHNLISRPHNKDIVPFLAGSWERQGNSRQADELAEAIRRAPVALQKRLLVQRVLGAAKAGRTERVSELLADLRYADREQVRLEVVSRLPSAASTLDPVNETGRRLARLPYPIAVTAALVDSHDSRRDRVFGLAHAIEMHLRLAVAVKLGLLRHGGHLDDQLRTTLRARWKGSLSFGGWLELLWSLDLKPADASLAPHEWVQAILRLPRDDFNVAANYRNRTAHGTPLNAEHYEANEAHLAELHQKLLLAALPLERVTLATLDRPEVLPNGTAQYEPRAYRGATEVFRVGEPRALPLLPGGGWAYMLSDESGGPPLSLESFVYVGHCAKCERREVFLAEELQLAASESVSVAGVATNHKLSPKPKTREPA